MTISQGYSIAAGCQKGGKHGGIQTDSITDEQKIQQRMLPNYSVFPAVRHTALSSGLTVNWKKPESWLWRARYLPNIFTRIPTCKWRGKPYPGDETFTDRRWNHCRPTKTKRQGYGTVNLFTQIGQAPKSRKRRKVFACQAVWTGFSEQDIKFLRYAF